MRVDRRRTPSRPGSRPGRSAALLVALSLVGGMIVLGGPGAATADSSSGSVSSDRAQAAALEAQISADGANVQKVVVAYDAAVTHQTAVAAEIAGERSRLAQEQARAAAARANLRALAVDAYMDGTDSGGALAELTDRNVMSLLAQRAYTEASGDDLSNAIDAVELDQARTQADEADLRVEEAKAVQAVATLASDKASAQAALTRDDKLLGQVKANLQGLLAAIAASQAAQERAQEEEEAMAAQQAQEAAAAAAIPPPAPVDPAPGQYADPIRAIADLGPERVDQGVDYRGYGPIYAVGDGVVGSIVNSGWPGGTFICYRLSDGPAAGLAVYAAEDIDPTVSVGESVTANTVLGTMYEGPDGIETGWADPSCDGVSMANDAGQFSGANSTAYGANMSELLASLGAPPGVMQNEPATGSLPPNWPQW